MENSNSARVVIDISHSFQTGFNTGIQRVVSHTITSLQKLGKNYVLIWHPFGSNDGFFEVTSLFPHKVSNKAFDMYKVYSQNRFLKYLLVDKLFNRLSRSIYLKSYIDRTKKNNLIRKGLFPYERKASDKLLILDVFWHDITLISKIEELHAEGMKVNIFFHDIFPLTNPEWFNNRVCINYKKVFFRIVKIVDEIATSSRSNKKEIENYLSATFSEIKTSKISVISLSASIARERISTNKQKGSGILWVGTIEPRKNLDLLLDLVESHELSMPVFICGRVGWKSRKTVSRLRKLHKLGKVVWHANATDKKVLEIAAVSSIGLITSKNEGFGLPLLEFRNFGLSVVAPQIEVFVEIDNGFVNFYEPDDLYSLAQTCRESELLHQNSDDYNIKSWEMFTEELCMFISGDSLI